MQSGLSQRMPFNCLALHKFQGRIKILCINYFAYFQILAGKIIIIANDLFFNQILNNLTMAIITRLVSFVLPL